MPRSEALQKWWDKNGNPQPFAPGKRHSNPEPPPFPDEGSADEKAQWYIEQFRHLARNARLKGKTQLAANLLQKAFAAEMRLEAAKAKGGGEGEKEEFRRELERKTADLRAKKGEADA